MKLGIQTFLAGAMALALAACSSGGGTTAAPSISTQPADQTVTLGSTATFTVVAGGSPGYQWKKNGAAIAGATAASYTTPAAVAGDDGASYTVDVSNDGGSVTSAAATLHVVWVEITGQSADQSVSAGDAAGLFVTATGNGALSYHWTKEGAAATGFSGPTVDFTPVTSGDEAVYGCHVVATLNGVSASADAAPMNLTVGSGPVLSASATTVVLGEGVVLTYDFAGTATLDSGSGPAPVTTGGYTVVYPDVDATYVLVANDGTEVVRTVDVHVKTYTPTYLYVANHDSNDVSVYPVVTDGFSGMPVLDPAASPTTPAGNGPVQVVASPNGATLYVVNSADATVSAFAVSATDGSLTSVAGSPFVIPGDTNPTSGAIDPSGHHLWVACDGGVRGFAIDPDSGALTASTLLGVDIAGRTTGDVLVNPAGSVLYVVNGGAGEIAAYAVDRATGALTAAGSWAAPGALALTLDRAGVTLFSRVEASDPSFNASLAAFAVDPRTGALDRLSTYEGLDTTIDPNRPFVRGPAGHHGLAFSRRPGIDRLFDTCAHDENYWLALSEYTVDLDAGTIGGDYVSAAGWSSPFTVGTFDIIYGSDSIVMDRGGSILVLTVPDWGRVYSLYVDADGEVWPASDFLGYWQPQDTGFGPQSGAFVGTMP